MTRLGFDRADRIAIGIGGAFGASLRWLLTRDAETGVGGWFAAATDSAANSTFPASTLVVNILGCLVLGALTSLIARSVPIPRRLLLGAATGFCGSLTTLSTFAVEVAALLRTSPMATSGPASLNVRVESEVSTALWYVVLSLVCGAGAFWLGRVATHRLVEVRPSSSGGPE